MKPRPNDCFLHDRDRLTHHEALALLRDGVVPVTTGEETVGLDAALGRVLIRPFEAPFDMPRHTNAAVDGYAYRHAETGILPVSDRVPAGTPPSPLASGTVARIFTGAALPKGADTVAMQEDCTLTEGKVALPEISAGANVRHKGEDIRQGGTVIPAGRRLTPADIASAAACGASELVVRRKLRVALFSSGDEVRAGGQLGSAEVFDANRPLLHAWSASLPVAIMDGGILPDRRSDVETALADAAAKCDIIITTGGASLGEEDHMLAALDRLGERKAWQIAVKPGRPLMFGRIGETAYLGLPGNPVAACVCFLLYARPLLLMLAGAGWHAPLPVTLSAAFTTTSKPDRREFLRGILRDGGIDRFARNGSGLVSSLREADGLIEVPEDVTAIEPGDPVRFLPWHAFL